MFTLKASSQTGSISSSEISFIFYQISLVVFSSISLPPVLHIKGHAMLQLFSMLNACCIYKAYFILLPPEEHKNDFQNYFKI